MKVLVVEDDLTSRLIMQRYLAPYGENNVAVDGKEAVEAFQLATEEDQPYDLVCLDILMPEMDGQEVLKRIREIEEEAGSRGLDRAKVIMTTALGDRKNIMGAFREQCDGYLVKPIDKKKFLKLLGSLGFPEESRS